jgi:hypothetical protein
MYRKSNRLPTATITYDCWGCHRILPMSVDDGDEPFGKKENRLVKELYGWVKRHHAPNVDIWYCSDNCAYNSRNAQICDAYWKKDSLLKQRSLYQRIKDFFTGKTYDDEFPALKL